MTNRPSPEWTPDTLARWTGGAWSCSPAAPPCGVSSDTRDLPGRSLFVALRGDRFDGHDFVSRALEAGAAAAVVERASLHRFEPGLPLLAVEDTRTALAAMAAGHRATLGARLVGITGSVGKTSVKELLADALAAEAETFRSPGNWNNDLGLPLSLLRMTSRHRFGVLELGMNHPGEIAALTGLLQPEAGIMTAIGPVHLEAFSDVEAIAREKSELLRGLPGGGWAVVSLDSPHADLFRRAAPCGLVAVSMSERRGADYRAVCRAAGVFEVEETATGACETFEAALPGRYVVENALLAIAGARRFGVSWAALQAAVRAYRPPPMRWEHSSVAGMDVINDAYNANPLSMREALRAFEAMPARGERWLVLGGMRELGPFSGALHRELGRDLARGPWAGLVACGEAADLIAAGAREGGMPPSRIHACADAGAAAEVLSQGTREGDAVLLKASRGERLERVLEAWKARAACRAGMPCGVTGETG